MMILKIDLLRLVNMDWHQSHLNINNQKEMKRKIGSARQTSAESCGHMILICILHPFLPIKAALLELNLIFDADLWYLVITRK